MSGRGGTEAIATTSADANVGAGGTGGAGGGDAGGSEPAAAGGDAPTLPAGMCPVLVPRLPVYYPGDPGFPCPDGLPVTVAKPEFPHCTRSLDREIQCIFPAPDLQGSEYRCICLGYGDTSVDSWACYEKPCNRTGDACLAGLEPSRPLVQLSGACADRQATACDVGKDETAQEVLDAAVFGVFSDCGAGCWLGGTLVVNFDRGCATSFVLGQDTNWDAPWFTEIDAVSDCVKQRLEASSFDCAGDFVCGRGGIGGVPGICEMWPP